MPPQSDADSFPLANVASNRRGIYRFPAALGRAWLGWWRVEEFHGTLAEIRDISLRGARLIVETLPPVGTSVWFHPPSLGTLSSAPADEWLEARLVEARKSLFGPRLVRVEFVKGIPDELFQAMVYGPGAVGFLQPRSWPVEHAGGRPPTRQLVSGRGGGEVGALGRAPLDFRGEFPDHRDITAT